MSLSRVSTSAPVRGARLLPNPSGVPSLDLLLANVREAAFQQGVTEGREQERSVIGPLLDGIRSQLEVSESEAAEELPRVAVHIATSIARTLLKREIQNGDYDIERMVRETLAEANVGRGTCSVHLHPADYAFLADTPFRGGTSIRSDEGVAKGDVQVETPLGLLVREGMGAVGEIERRLLEDLA